MARRQSDYGRVYVDKVEWTGMVRCTCRHFGCDLLSSNYSQYSSLQLLLSVSETSLNISQVQYLPHIMPLIESLWKIGNETSLQLRITLPTLLKGRFNHRIGKILIS